MTITFRNRIGTVVKQKPWTMRYIAFVVTLTLVIQVVEVVTHG